jgi:hypothetical protein
MRFALALVVLAGLAHADPRLGKFKGGSVGRVQVTRTTWRFELVTSSIVERTLVIPIHLPPDVAIDSIAMASRAIGDQATLEYVSATERRLTVSPVTVDLPATITIAWHPGRDSQRTLRAHDRPVPSPFAIDPRGPGCDFGKRLDVKLAARPARP